MDDLTRVLWRTADAATAAEVQAEARLGRDGKNDGKAALARLRAWAALLKHRRAMHREALDKGQGK